MFSKDTYISRRQELKKLVNSGIVILFGNNNSPCNFPNNGYYPFRQDSTFLYYFGQQRVEMVGVLGVHAAGDRAGQRADGMFAVGEQQIGLADGQTTDAVMLRSRAVAELEHIAEDGDAAALGPRAEAGEDIERGLGRLGTGVVAVLDDGEAVALVDLLAHAGILEAGDLRLDGLGRNLEQERGRDGGQRVIDRMAAQHGDKQLKAVAEAADDKAHAVFKLLNVRGEHVAGVIFDAEVVFFVAAVRTDVPQQGLVTVEDADAVFRHAAEDLELGLQDALAGAQVLDVHGADVGDLRSSFFISSF